MLDVFAWLFAVEILGLLAFPVVYVLLPWLPDRGYSVAKPVGLLLVFYPLWLLASTPVIPNRLPTILAILLALGVASVALLWRRRVEIQEFLRREGWVLLATEAVFLGMFALWAVIRSQDPGISHTEQPMDFAFLNSTVLSMHFPPNDPWLAGETVSYYYFGHLIMGGVGRLAAVPTEVAYNLGIALVAGMAAAAMFGLGTNLVRLTGGRVRGAMVTGFIASFLLIGMANLESGLELVRAGGGGTEGFWKWVSIEGLDAPAVSSGWVPSEHWWWWRASRVINTLDGGQSLDFTITEFPFFSLLLGDLHAHLLALPFVLTFVTLTLNFVVSPVQIGLSWVRDRWTQAAGLALVLGALAFINLWDMVTFGTLFAVAAVAKGYGRYGSLRRGFTAGMAVVGPVVVVALALYLPFYLSFTTQARGILPVDGPVTRPFHFLIVWGMFLWIVVPFLIWEMASVVRRGVWRRREGVVVVIVSVAPWLAWVIAEAAVQILRRLVGDGVLTPWLEGLLLRNIEAMGGLALLDMAWGRFLHLLPLTLMLAGATYIALRRTSMHGQADAAGGTGREETEGAARMFPVVLAGVAVLLLIGPELFYILDVFNNRMNTMFKMSYQAWTLLALVSAYALYYLGSRYGRSGPVVRVAGYGWIGLLTVGFIVTMYYPAASVISNRSGLSGLGTLDGLAYVASTGTGELAAIHWLKENGLPDDRMVEAVGDDYSAYGRVSASTGIPTVLGWTFHEEQWRGSREPFEGRQEAVRLLYQTTDVEEAREILSRYGVTYIIVGPRERTTYGTVGLGKFDSLGDVVFPEAEHEGDVVIYRVRT